MSYNLNALLILIALFNNSFSSYANENNLLWEKEVKEKLISNKGSIDDIPNISQYKRLLDSGATTPLNFLIFDENQISSSNLNIFEINTVLANKDVKISNIDWSPESIRFKNKKTSYILFLWKNSSLSEVLFYDAVNNKFLFKYRVYGSWYSFGTTMTKDVFDPLANNFEGNIELQSMFDGYDVLPKPGKSLDIVKLIAGGILLILIVLLSFVVPIALIMVPFYLFNKYTLSKAKKYGDDLNLYVTTNSFLKFFKFFTGFHGTINGMPVIINVDLKTSPSAADPTRQRNRSSTTIRILNTNSKRPFQAKRNQGFNIDFSHAFDVQRGEENFKALFSEMEDQNEALIFLDGDISCDDDFKLSSSNNLFRISGKEGLKSKQCILFMVHLAQKASRL